MNLAYLLTKPGGRAALRNFNATTPGRAEPNPVKAPAPDQTVAQPTTAIADAKPVVTAKASPSAALAAFDTARKNTKGK